MTDQRADTRQPSRQQLPPEAESAGAVAVIEAPRLPFHPYANRYGVDPVMWSTLVNAIYPSAMTPEGIVLALAYCKARNLDPMKRPVHIVPMYTKKLTGDGKKVGIMIETIWPGISEVRTTAFRTGVYAGADEMALGPTVSRKWDVLARSDDDDGQHPNAPPSANKKTEAGPKVLRTIELSFPEWAQLTVYRIVQGQRVAFTGPRVYWIESYATLSRFSDAPNQMWEERPIGQLQKCTEAAALRGAFPEELGGEYIVDEANRRMGAMVDISPTAAEAGGAPAAVRPEKQNEPSSVANTPAARAARARQEATTVDTGKKTTDQPKPTSESVDPSTGEIKPSTASGPPELSDELEHALSVLSKTWVVEEIDGARDHLRTALTADDFKVWQTASLEQTKRINKK